MATAMRWQAAPKDWRSAPHSGKPMAMLKEPYSETRTGLHSARPMALRWDSPTDSRSAPPMEREMRPRMATGSQPATVMDSASPMAETMARATGEVTLTASGKDPPTETDSVTARARVTGWDLVSSMDLAMAKLTDSVKDSG